MTTEYNILFALACGLVAYVYCHILTSPGMILGWWGKFLDNKIGLKSCRPVMWLWKPLIGCHECVAGQIALWSYFFIPDTYIWYQHITVICMAIFSTLIYQKIDLVCQN